MLNIAATYAGEVGVKGVAVIGMNPIQYCLGTKAFRSYHKISFICQELAPTP